MSSPLTILNDALSPSLFAKVKDTIQQRDFPWNFAPFPTAIHSGLINDDRLENHCFSHRAKVYAPGLNQDERKKYGSEYADLFEAALLSILDKTNQRIRVIHKINIGFVTPLPGNTSIINLPHVDLVRPHQVGLLYINNSDGNTVIYNEKFDKSSLNYKDVRDSIYHYETFLKGNMTVADTYTPKENSFVSFDGMHYHSSSTPLGSNRRIAINYNYETL